MVAVPPRDFFIFIEKLGDLLTLFFFFFFNIYKYLFFRVSSVRFRVPEMYCGINVFDVHVIVSSFFFFFFLFLFLFSFLSSPQRKGEPPLTSVFLSFSLSGLWHCLGVSETCYHFFCAKENEVSTKKCYCFEKSCSNNWALLVIFLIYGLIIGLSFVDTLTVLTQALTSVLTVVLGFYLW